jgi:hypothetical protein
MLSQTAFLKSLPEQVLPHLPQLLRERVQIRQPWRRIVQFHFGEPRLHYEVGPASGRDGFELGLHCEARDKKLNRYLLTGFRRHLFEIKDELGESLEAEMWDRGWTKIYEVYPPAPLTPEYQAAVGRRLAEIITYLHPIYAALRGDVARMHR